MANKEALKELGFFEIGQANELTIPSNLIIGYSSMRLTKSGTDSKLLTLTKLILFFQVAFIEILNA